MSAKFLIVIISISLFVAIFAEENILANENVEGMKHVRAKRYGGQGGGGYGGQQGFNPLALIGQFLGGNQGGGFGGNQGGFGGNQGGWGGNQGGWGGQQGSESDEG
uniref:Uncharacterized protein n=1 Tax=Acrobeloides nanus TaxID=290746 RepID=A0A914DPG1_9BILA